MVATASANASPQTAGSLANSPLIDDVTRDRSFGHISSINGFPAAVNKISALTVSLDKSLTKRWIAFAADTGLPPQGGPV